ncbi:hypothetical protein [Pseudonocardia sp. HH130630-07]|uniref:hypothetical protein n=1 Tax=Pseudonocardia sp. HH130630-07 TaxID=1690815 RepID=UPI000814FC05|nr:hypothetical protein [Pseudonocardia sp. HH130630-07]ANY08228.1 hypothetical protein AFB00_20290 [Pseudonocardia sp. HH130630-07]
MTPPGVSALAVALAPAPEVWRKLLATHVRAGDGGCAVCRSQVSGAQSWPCSLHRAAVAAQEIAGADAARRGVPSATEPGPGC